MKNLKLFFIGLLATSTLFMTSCDPEEVSVTITGLSVTAPVAGVGIVDESAKTISINVPFGTDVSNVTGTVTTDPADATVSPSLASGVDFSAGSVTFTVTHSDGTTTSDYVVSIVEGENPLRIVLVGDGAMDTQHDETQEAYNWAMATYGNKAAYVSFQDLASTDLSTTQVIWWHAYDTVNGGRTQNAAAVAASSTVSDYVKGGGNMLLTTHATGYLVDIGRLGSDWGPTDGGYGNNDGFDNPDDWGWAFEYPTDPNTFPTDNASHPMWANTTKKSVTFDGVTYDMSPGIDGGKKRDAAYFWFVRNIPGVIANFDTNGDGGLDDLEALDTNGDGVVDPATDNVHAVREYFQTQTGSTVRGSFEWDPVVNGAEFFTAVEFGPQGDYAGSIITISAGAFEFLHSDGRTNAWRGNQEAMAAGAFTHFGVL